MIITFHIEQRNNRNTKVTFRQVPKYRICILFYRKESVVD